MSSIVNNPISTELTHLHLVETLIKAGTWIFDLQLNSVYWSDGVYKMLGYEPQSFPIDFEVGTKTIHPDDQKRAVQHMQDVLQKNLEYNITKRLINSKGQAILVQSKASIIRDEKGNPVKLIGVFHDITEFVEISQQLEEARQTSHLLLENADGIFWEADAADFRFTYISPQVEEITGYTTGEWLADPNFWSNHIHPEDRDAAIRFCHNETAALNNHIFDYRFRTRSGSYVWIHDRVKVTSKDGKPDKLTGLMLDVSSSYFYSDLDKIEKKLLEAAIQQDAQLFSIIESYLLDLEKLFPDMRASVMKIQHGAMYVLAAPSLPPGYCNAINGIKIGLNQGSCGTAAYLKEKVIAGNVHDDERWASYTGLAEQYGFSACWSHPLLNDRGEAVATLALYYSNPRGPNAFEEFAIERSERLLSLVITKFENLDNLKISNDRFELLNRGTKDAIYDWNIESDNLVFGEGYGRLFGYTDHVNKSIQLNSWKECIHPADRNHVSESLNSFLADSKMERWEYSYRFRKKEGIYANVEEIGHIIRDMNGKPVRMVGLMRDTTETKELQKLLNNASKLALVGGWELNLRNIEQPVFTCSAIAREILETGSLQVPDWESFLSMAVEPSRLQLKQAVEKLINDAMEFDLEVPIITTTENRKWVRIIGQSEWIDNKCNKIYGSIQDIYHKKTNELELSRKNRLLDTLSIIISSFLQVEDWTTILPGIFEITGQTAEVDRVYYFELHKDTTAGPLLSTQLYEWTREDISKEIDNPHLQRVPVMIYPGFFGPLLKGSPVQLVTSKVTEEDLHWILENQQIKSCLALPVMVENECVGLIGFDACREERFWEESEISFLTNITVNLAAAIQRKNNQLQLEHALFERNTILESIGDGFCAINQEGEITYWNKQAEIMFNLPRQQVEKQKATSVLADALQINETDTILQNFYSHEKKSIEFHKDPTNQWFDIEIYPAGNGNSVFIRDITSRKLSEAQIRQSNERFEIITRATNDAIWDYDVEKNLLFWGRGFYTLFGYNPQENTPSFQMLINLIHPDDRELIITKIKGYMGGSIASDTWDEEYRFLKANGEYAFVADKAIFIRNEKGLVIRALGAMSDISHRKEYETSLEDLNQELEKKVKELAISNQELEQFAYVASHDLQEPLRMVTGFLTQLEKKYQGYLDEKAHQYIYYATDGAKRMRQIILDLLDFSRIGKQKEKITLINLNRLVEETISLNRNLLEEKKAEVEFHDLPVISSYHSPLRQVFQNLITNAVKYSKPGLPPKIRISATDQTTAWKIAIEDNGIGIPPEYHERIFIIFQRLHKREEYGGTGIGLAVVKKIIDNLGGTIWVESIPGEGSTFYFTLPKTPPLQA
ncbi:MAG: PAS domain-containing protein [Flavipsychrobacter sp.]|nr:PAS domain-containing protein [Flavipsychrobacter sp.]